MKNKVGICVIILLVVVLVASSTYLYMQYKQEKEEENIFEELSNVIIENDTNNKEMNNKKNVTKLYEENNDFIGWLEIEDTNICYPVMKTEQERKDYYLKRNFYKEYSNMGTPYIAGQCDIIDSDNIIIYGHHITNNKMFGELENYKDKKFYNSHKIINFNTIYGEMEYEIIAVFKTIAYSDTGFKYYNFIKAENEQEYNAFINKCKVLSLYQTEKTAIYGDKLLTLSTCEYSNKNR